MPEAVVQQSEMKPMHLVMLGGLVVLTVVAMATTPIAKVFGIEGLQIFEAPTHGGCDPKGLAKVQKYLNQLNQHLAELKGMRTNPEFARDWDKIDREINSAEREKRSIENTYGNCPADGKN